MKRLFIFLTGIVCSLICAFTGCSDHETASTSPTPGPQHAAAEPTRPPNALDACSLITSAEIEKIQGSAPKGTTPTFSTDNGLVLSHCYFLLPIASESVVLSVTQKEEGPKGRDPVQAWKELFHSGETKKEQNKDEDQGPLGRNKIEGLGDEAFWIPRKFGGGLYTLKGHAYIRISVGGKDDRNVILQRAKALAETALKRL